MGKYIVTFAFLLSWGVLFYSLKVCFPAFKRVVFKKDYNSPIKGDHSDLQGAFGIVATIMTLVIVVPMVIITTIGLLIEFGLI